MIEKYINDYGKECYRGVDEKTPFRELEFHEVLPGIEGDTQFALHTNIGTLTVLDRMTGFGYRDTETGYRDTEGKFWLASGGYDVRIVAPSTLGKAIEWVKKHANNCQGD